MNKLYCLIILFFSCIACDGQNLVPNGDFEQYSGCPNNFEQLDSALFWMNPSTNLPNTGSPDYMNGCASWPVGVPVNLYGNQSAHSGVGYCGIFIWINTWPHYREYIEAPLTSPLIANECYHFEMYVSLGNSFAYTTDDIGVYFSNTPVTGINNVLPLPFVPQLNNTPEMFLIL